MTVLFTTNHAFAATGPKSLGTNNLAAEIMEAADFTDGNYAKSLEGDLSKFDRVVAYFGGELNTHSEVSFKGLIDLASRHGNKVIVVTCTTSRPLKTEMITKSLEDPSTVIWGSSCDGRVLMEEIFDFFCNNGHLPSPEDLETVAK